LAAVAAPGTGPLVTLDLPLEDLYGEHWSLGGPVPGHDTPDDAVYLPGRNPLLLIKPAVWCALHRVGRLALAPLASNPFPDARGDFFAAFERMIELATGWRLAIERPFAGLHKVEVMRLGRAAPLELTFSCIAPDAGQHCGRCNKCHERKLAFRDAGLQDRTRYRGGTEPATAGP
jgi:7-cyano-7-deazaguanine synthase